MFRRLVKIRFFFFLFTQCSGVPGVLKTPKNRIFFFVKVVFRCSSVPGVLKTPKKPNPDFSIYSAGVTLNELGVKEMALRDE